MSVMFCNLKRIKSTWVLDDFLIGLDQYGSDDSGEDSQDEGDAGTADKKKDPFPTQNGQADVSRLVYFRIRPYLTEGLSLLCRRARIRPNCGRNKERLRRFLAVERRTG